MTPNAERSAGATVVTAILAGIAGVVGSYALAGYTQSFVAAPIASFVTQNAPSALLKFAIGPLTAFGRAVGIAHLGQRANLLLALVIAVVVFAILTGIALAIGRRVGGVPVSVGLAGVLVWVATTLITNLPMTAVGAGVGSGVVVAVAVFAARSGETTDTSVSHGRREVLGSVASAIGVGVVGYLLGGQGGSKATQPAAQTGASGGTGTASGGGGNASGAGNASGGTKNASVVKQRLADAESKSLDIEGIDGLVSRNNFYEVDIDNINPSLNRSDWSLSVTGAVENKQEFSYDDIIGMKSKTLFNTLRCVSDPLNGHEMDNAVWTGVPIKQVIDAANPQGKFVMGRAADDYYEEFPVSALKKGLLAYRMNGNPLPQKHGYPVRALIPGHFGEINVKWLTEFQILDRSAKGFWEKKGWHGTGPVNTVAKFHAVNHLDNGKIQVGGHAYAGTRGIKRVEVSTDGGNSWKKAKLSKVPKPNLHGDVWRQWAYTYQPPNGKHEVVVRAVDGTGTLQPKKHRNAYPSGATGWISKTING